MTQVVHQPESLAQLTFFIRCGIWEELKCQFGMLSVSSRSSGNSARGDGMRTFCSEREETMRSGEQS